MKATIQVFKTYTGFVTRGGSRMFYLQWFDCRTHRAAYSPDIAEETT